MNLVEAETVGHRARRGHVVARQHDDADSLSVQSVHDGFGVLLDPVGDGDDAADMAVDRDEDGGGAMIAQAVGLVR